MLQHPVPRNSKQVCAQSSTRHVILLGLAHQGHEHILHNLFRRPGIPGHAQAKPIQTRLVTAVEHDKGLFVALGGTSQQNVVRGLLGNPHLPCVRRLPGLLALSAFSIISRGSLKKFPVFRNASLTKYLELPAGSMVGRAANVPRYISRSLEDNQQDDLRGTIAEWMRKN